MMKLIKLPFKIGDDYENWEYDLEISKIDRILGYDSYIYIRELSFLGLVPQYTEFIFSWDILQCVVFTFNFESQKQLQQFRDILNLNLGESKILQNEYLIANTYQFEELKIWLIHIHNSYQIQIAYGWNFILQLLYN